MTALSYKKNRFIFKSLFIFCRFVEYWARIGSEDNMTMCHHPTCRKEGVLLDYSTDGGGVTVCFFLFFVPLLSVFGL